MGRKNTGSIRWLDKARTRAQLRITVGCKPNGDPIQRQMTWTRGKGDHPTDPQDALAAFRLSVGAPTDGPGSETLKHFLERWLVAYSDPDPDDDIGGEARSQATITQYTRFVNTILVPSLGSIRLNALRGEDVKRMLLEKREQGMGRGGRQNIVKCLSTALSWGTKQGIISTNVAKGKAPRYKAPESPPPTDAEMAKIRQAARDRHDAYGDAIILGSLTGMREAEICGLTVGSWDPEKRVLRMDTTILKAPRGFTRGKGKTGPRNLRIKNAEAIEVIEANCLDDEGNPKHDREFLFGEGTEKPMMPDLLGKAYRATVKGLINPRRHQTFHGLRHYVATKLGEDPNIPATSAAAYLGHDVKVFWKTYCHSRSQEEVADALAL